MGSNQSKPIKDEEQDEKENRGYDSVSTTRQNVKKMKTTSFTINEKTTNNNIDSTRKKKLASHKSKCTNSMKDEEYSPKKNISFGSERIQKSNTRTVTDLAQNPIVTGANGLDGNVDRSGMKLAQTREKPSTRTGASIPDEIGGLGLISHSISSVDSASKIADCSKVVGHSSLELNIPIVPSISAANQNTCISSKAELDTSIEDIIVVYSRGNVKHENESRSNSKVELETAIQERNSVNGIIGPHYTDYNVAISLPSLPATNTLLSPSHLPNPPLSPNFTTSASFTPSLYSSNTFDNITQTCVCTSVSSSNSPGTTSLPSQSSTNPASLSATNGNFSMNGDLRASGNSSAVFTGSSLANITPSDSHSALPEQLRQPATRSDTQTTGNSSANEFSSAANYLPTYLQNEFLFNSNSHASLFSSNTTNSSLNISRDDANTRQNILNYFENYVDVDSLDLINDNAFALPASAVERNRTNFDRNYITIRTSVGDTTTRISSRNITLSSHADADLTDENMGIILERPKYPRYATLASRVQSYENSWPVTNKISWKKLPEAGFVYTGTADCVRCYYCNGGLREWLENDCPWTEHARYYPHCPHVRQCRGDEFIRKVRNGADDWALAEDDHSGEDMEVDTVAGGITLSREHEAMKIAAEIISNQTLLEKAAYYIKNIQGKSFDAQELAGVAFEIEEGAIVCGFEDSKEDNRIDVEDEVLKSDSDGDTDIEVDCDILEEENRLLRERSLCRVCLDGTASVLFLDCGHMIACPMCAPALKTCAVCRAEVKGTVRTKYATDR